MISVLVANTSTNNCTFNPRSMGSKKKTRMLAFVYTPSNTQEEDHRMVGLELCQFFDWGHICICCFREPTQ
jgi:hypothetical protein